MSYRYTTNYTCLSITNKGNPILNYFDEEFKIKLNTPKINL